MRCKIQRKNLFGDRCYVDCRLAAKIFFYGEKIVEKNGCLVNAEGRLAGSAIGMIDAVRLTNTWVGLDLDESLRMASLYPAEFMQLDHHGKIQPSYRADLVHFTEDFRVTHTSVGEMLQHMSAD